MVLTLPAAPLGVEGNLAVHLHPGHIDAGQLLPRGVALRRGHVGLLIHDVLEVIHHGAVGDEGQCACQMAVQELAGVGAKEALRPRPCEELHAHGVYLAALQRRPDVAAGDALAVGPVGKGVTGLVGHHLHVMLGAVEVGEDKGYLIVAQAGAVAACLLALGAQHVQQLVVQHGAEEHLRLGGQLAVELHALCQNIVGRTHGAGVAGAELQRQIREAQGIGLAQTLRLLAADLVRHRHQILLHGGAELLHVLLGVAVAVHAVVAQRGIALVAHLLAHGITQMHQLVVQFIQLRRVLHGPLGVGLPRRQTAGVIGVALEGRQLGQGVGLALKGDLGGGQQFLVLLGQVVLLLHLRDDLRLKALPGDLGVQEHQVAVLRGKVLAERGVQHGSLPRLLILLQLRAEGVPELLLSVVEGVAGVDGVADGSQRGLRLHGAGRRLLLQKDLPRLLVGSRVLQPLRQLAHLLLQRLRIRTGIGHLGKLHVLFLLVEL